MWHCMSFKNLWFSFSCSTTFTLLKDCWSSRQLGDELLRELCRWSVAESPKVRLPDQALPCRHKHQRNLHDSTVFWLCSTIYSKRTLIHWDIYICRVRHRHIQYNNTNRQSYLAALTSAFTSSFRWWRTMCLLLGIHKAAAMVSELKEGSITMMAPWTPLFWRLSANS